MKRIIAVLLLLVGIGYIASAQSVIPLSPSNRAITGWNFQTYTNFTATSDDTSSVVTVPIDGEPLLAREVRLIAIATDSCNADVYVVGTHNELSKVTVTYSDSINVGNNPTAASPTVKIITLRGPGVNQLSGCTRFAVGTVFRATLNGTTTGRTLKWYLQWIK